MLLAMNVEHYLIFWVISSIAFINLLVSASENQHKDNIPSVRSSMVDEERIRFVHRLGSVVSVSFGALTLLVGWQEGYPASTKTCTTYLIGSHLQLVKDKGQSWPGLSWIMADTEMELVEIFMTRPDPTSNPSVKLASWPAKIVGCWPARLQH